PEGEPGVRHHGDVEPEIGVLGLDVHAVGAERATGPVADPTRRARAGADPLDRAPAVKAVLAGRAAAGPPDDVADFQGPHRPRVLVAGGDVGPEAEPVADVVEAVLESRGLCVDEVCNVVASGSDHSGLPV